LALIVFACYEILHMSTLQYKSNADIDDLVVGTCTMRRVTTSAGARYWNLWFCVNRETDGQPDIFVVPINPNGSYIENGLGGKTWGLTATEPGTWQVSPSINVLNTREAHPGVHVLPSLWHQTPAVVGVPAGEPWIGGAPP
jgi:hypothetical protein